LRLLPALGTLSLQWPSTLSGIHPLVSCAHRCFGDLLASAINPKVGAWLLSPMASEIEARTIRWITEIVGCYTNCGGLFVSGGNMANLICFLAARQAKAAGMCEKWG
jgi:glutamate/tyrosine decarboxylase-like PLP-dependent enzyme